MRQIEGGGGGVLKHIVESTVIFMGWNTQYFKTSLISGILVSEIFKCCTFITSRTHNLVDCFLSFNNAPPGR